MEQRTRTRTVIDHELAGNPHPISPLHFAQAMRQRWESLGNASTPKLEETWIGMAQAFSRAVMVGTGSIDASSRERTQWQVLQPPTGTGKTQGACVYSAMVARLNRKLPVGFSRTGVLIVTRLKKEADGIADAINDMAETTCAITRHSDNMVTRHQMAAHDVLVITHQAYLNALESSVLGHGDDQLDSFLSWDAGSRLLTIIDESLSELVKSYHATEEDFRITAALIDQETALAFPWASEQVKSDASTVGKIVALFLESDPDEAKRTKLVWEGAAWDPEWPSHRAELLALRRRMAEMRFDRILLGRDDVILRRSIAERVDRTLEASEAMRLDAGYRSGDGGKFTIHMSKLLLPENLPGPAILDATAEQEPLWELLGRRVRLAEKVDGVRNYRNVTLHVARGSAVGKTGMVSHDDQRLNRLLDNLNKLLAGRRVFLCVHKQLEPLAWSYETSFAEYSVDHWWNVDGRNDWREFDVAVLFGLPYKPQTWAIDMLQAVRKLMKPRNPLSIGAHRNWEELKKSLQTRQIAASVIQAINRIRCRRVVDTFGNCATADAYLVLPQNKLGDDVLSRIVSEMPGVEVRDWDFELDGVKKPVSKAHYAEAVLGFMKNQPPGDTSLKVLCEELHLGRNARKDLQADLRNPDHPLTRSLADLGVSYHASGRGAGARSHLLKR